MKKAWKYIKQKIYDYFHPSIYDVLNTFGIVEPTITKEEAERCLKLIDEWREEYNAE